MNALPSPHPSSSSSITPQRASGPGQQLLFSHPSSLPSEANKRPRKLKLCRYYATDSGCRAGSSCPFVHDQAALQDRRAKSNHAAGLSTPGTAGTATSGRNKQAVQKPLASRVVIKPTPKAQVENPREYQLGQIRKRYKPKETLVRTDESRDAESAILLDFKLIPSDPDFPFEMDALHCRLKVPPRYPDTDDGSRPRLTVKNNDIPRGFAVNVERGFDGLVAGSPSSTLLALISALDKNLENFLSEKKAETVKLVANADIRHLANLPVRTAGAPPEAASSTQQPLVIPEATRVQAPARPEPPLYTPEQKIQAEQRRATETRQLEARLGRLPLYKKSGDGIAYTLPVEPRKRDELPSALQAVKAVKLFVPLLYPLQPCRIQLENVPPDDAKSVELAFVEKAKQSNEMTLMAQVNALAQNMHIMAKYTPAIEAKPKPPLLAAVEEVPKPVEPLVSAAPDDDRSHIQVIPRPPEWATTDSDHDENSSTDSDYSYDSEDESDEGGIPLEAEAANKHRNSTHNAEKGTALSFPSIELYGIELLELTILNLIIKCERCKSILDITGLKNGTSKSESCRKCATPLSVTYHAELIHMNAVRAGFLDLEGCTAVDMLPSFFTPTCATCSTPYPAPGLTSVRGETISNVCRHCHQKFTFSLPDLKLLRISNAAHPPNAPGPRRKPDSALMLGLVAGTELPKRGRCRHYARSYRWFRFSCCVRVYACDRCHDEAGTAPGATPHPLEHAHRMICGFCSREQNFRPEDCGVCHARLVGGRASGFWEGGRGTRDRVRMSRKDKRKFRRPGGQGAAKAKAKEKAS